MTLDKGEMLYKLQYILLVSNELGHGLPSYLQIEGADLLDTCSIVTIDNIYST